MKVNATLLYFLGTDFRKLSSGVEELDKGYTDLSGIISAVWGSGHTYDAYIESQNEETPGYSSYDPPVGEEVSEEPYIHVSSDFHLETLRLIRDTNLLLDRYSHYGPELKTYLHRWVFGCIVQIVDEQRSVLQSGEPTEYERRSLYRFAFEKLSSAISYYDFLRRLESYMPSDPSYKGELPQLWRELIHKRESIHTALLTDSRAFTPADVDALLVYLGAIDKSSRKWIETKPGKGGNQSMFPAAYAALYKRHKVRTISSDELISICKLEYNADISPSTAEKWANTDVNGRSAFDRYFIKALEWLDTPPVERDSL